MTKTLKRTLIKVFSAMAVLACMFAAMVLTANGAETDAITMTDGAYIRVDAPGDGGVTGLKFEATVPKSTVEDWIKNNDKVEYGMLIMPADYATEGRELSEANVFGPNAIYTYKGDSSPEGKTYIVNVCYSDKDMLRDDGTNYYIHGTIASVKYQNLDRDFVALAYVKLTKGGAVTYQMANTTAEKRSAVQVAKGACDSDSYSDDIKAWCKDTINLSLTYRINEAKKLDSAANIEAFDKAYARVTNLYNVLGKTFFNENVSKADITALNEKAEAAKESHTLAGYAMVGTATTVPEGYTAINKTNAPTLADFIALLNATPAGNFALIEDLDFGGEISGSVVKSFTGTLDGQGHKISNFEIKFGLNTAENDYISVIFENNSGTIQNIAFDYTLGTANNSNVGLIMQNDGTIQNVYVNVNFKAYQWTTGAIAGINGSTGTIQNCVTVLNTTLTDQAAKNRLGSIVGVDYNGKILNCYSIVNGIHELTIPYVDTWGNGNYTGSKNYASMAALVAEVTSFDSANGWSSVWKEVDTSGKNLTDTYQPIGATGAAPEAPVIPEGAQALNMINAGTPAAFAELLGKTPSGHFVLTENLDWNNALYGNTYNEWTAVKFIEGFSGILDGQGYTISNFRLGHSGDNSDSAMFGVMTGTIKNIGFDYTLATANSGYTGLINTNNSTIENVFAKVIIQNRSWSTGILAGINSGTIKNCITVIDAASTGTGNNLAGIVGAHRGGSVDNCYTISNGHTTTDTAYTETTVGGSGVEVYKNYADMAAFITDTTKTAFNADSGWSEHWSIADGAVKFAPPVVDTRVDITVTVGEGTSTTATAGKIEPGTEFSFTAALDESLTETYELLVTLNGQRIAPDAEGYYRIYITKACDIVIGMTRIDGATELNMTNAGTPAALKALLNATPDGHFVLTEDLDFAGAIWVGAIDFAGTLDGNGYSIKNFSINYNAGSDNGSCPYVFASNSGTIENLKFVYSFDEAYNNHQAGLIKINKGTVENVYFDITVNQSTSDYNQLGLVASDNNGTIKNCVLDVKIGSGVTLATDAAGLVAFYNRNGGNIENVYVASSGEIGIAACQWATANNTKVYASMSALSDEVTFDAADGWSDNWSIENGEVKFAPAETRTELNMTNAGTVAALKALLNATPDGHFILTSDIDLGGEAWVGATDFAGTLDGQGYSIKNFNINYNAGSDNGYNSYLFNSNSGTIKNIGFVYNMTALNNNKGAIILTNTGTLENIYVDCTLKTSISSVWYQVGSLTHTNQGNMNNVIAKLKLDDGITVTQNNDGIKTFGVITSYNNESGVMTNCYAINDDNLPYAMYPWATQTDVKIESSASKITSLPEANGWNTDIWEAKDSTVYFNGTPLSTPMVSLAASADATYHIDLSGVQGTISALTVNGTDRLSALSGTTLNLPVNGVGAAVQNVVVTTTDGKIYNLTVNCSDLIDTILIKSDYYAGYTNASAFGNSEAETMFMRALNDFVALYKEFTGIDVVVKSAYGGANNGGYVNSSTGDTSGNINYSNNTLVLGRYMAETAGVYDETGLTTDTGYKAVKYKNSTFVYGKTEFGTANALYDILKTQYGVEFYSADVYTHTENTTPIKLGAITELFNPSIDYNWAIDGDMYTYNADGTRNINYKALLRLGFINSWAIQNAGYHDSTNLLDGQNTASDWIKNLTSDVETSFKNLNWAATSTNSDGKTLAQVVAEVMAGKINAAKAETKIFFIGVPDHVPESQSSYGTTDQYLAFVNAVAKELEGLITRAGKIELVMMAYAGTTTAPTGTTKFYNGTKVDVKVMYAPIRMLQNYDANNDEYTNPDGMTVKDFMDNYEAWKKLGDKGDVYVWNYSATFGNFFMPTDTIDHMLSQYQAFVGSGIDHMMNQGYQLSPVQTNFAALKTYLKGQLAKNVNMTAEQYDQLIRDFCNAYYGAAGEIMYDLLKMEEDHMNGIQAIMSEQTIYFNGNKFASTVDISSYYNLMTTKEGNGIVYATRTEMLRDVYWGGDTNIFTIWYAEITKALACDGLTDEQIERIQVEAIAIRYMSLKVHRKAVYSGDSMAKIITDAKALGITMYSENGKIDSLS